MPKTPIVALTVFLGSFLLFAVQPMMGRMLLPAFGGSAAVWTVCLVAYQILLLARYAYAHGLSQWRYERQRRLMLGISFRLRVLVVCHCHRTNDTVLRLISARKADKQEEVDDWSGR